MPNKLAISFCFLLALAYAKDEPGGYKIVGYSQPPSDTQPTFTIVSGGITITARCQNYYGDHIGCDQLKAKVGVYVTSAQMSHVPGNKDILQYNPNGFDKTCGGDCEFLDVTARKSGH